MSVWIYENTLTRFDMAFDLHVSSLSLAVRVHAWATAIRVHGSATACFDFSFDSHVGSPSRSDP